MPMGYVFPAGGYRAVSNGNAAHTNQQYTLEDFTDLSDAEPGTAPVDDFCSVCREAFGQIGNIRTNCDHFYHRQCISKWVETGHKNCPACREEFVQKSLCTRIKEWFSGVFSCISCCFRFCRSDDASA